MFCSVLNEIEEIDDDSDDNRLSGITKRRHLYQEAKRAFSRPKENQRSRPVGSPGNYILPPARGTDYKVQLHWDGLVGLNERSVFDSSAIAAASGGTCSSAPKRTCCVPLVVGKGLTSIDKCLAS